MMLPAVVPMRFVASALALLVAILAARVIAAIPAGKVSATIPRPGRRRPGAGRNRWAGEGGCASLDPSDGKLEPRSTRRGSDLAREDRHGFRGADVW